jgi:hypothetical protein
MAEVTDEPIYEVLTAIQATLGSLSESVPRIERRLEIVDTPTA